MQFAAPADRSILDSIRRIVHSLRVSSRASERELGVSGAQLYILQLLTAATSLTINELAERTRTHQSSVSAVVKRLSDACLVRRQVSDEDARRAEVSISPSGRRVVERAPKLVQERLLDAVTRLAAEEREQLAGLLEKLVREAGLSKEPANLFFETDNPS